jgi:hypothetical protein
MSPSGLSTLNMSAIAVRDRVMSCASVSSVWAK